VPLNTDLGSVSRFRNPDTFTVMRAKSLPPPAVRALPKFPSDLESKGISGAVLVAYVIDTTGRIDLKSASFLNAAHPDFANAVCDYLPRVRYEPFLAGNTKLRILVVQLHEFIAPGPESPEISEASLLQSRTEDEFMRTPVAAIIDELDKLPHCAPR
jgi:hypothetical protein